MQVQCQKDILFSRPIARNLVIGKSGLLGAVRTLLLSAHENKIKSGKRADDEQKQEEEAGGADDPDLRFRFSPGGSFLAELYLQHLEKFLRFLLAVAVGLQEKRFILAHERMETASSVPHRRKLIAYVSPMALFLGLLALGSGLKQIGGAFWLSSPEYWIYPAQTIICAGLIWRFRREYDFGKLQQPIFVLAVGLSVFLLWISPQVIFGFAPRTEGFNPNVFANQSPLYWLTIGLRFLRLAIVVPLVEEIFWRGFLLRYLIDDKFYAVSFGKFSAFSFWSVSAAFALAHSMPDWAAAFITGMTYNAVAYRTKSLRSCVMVHAVTNLFLGLWIMRTQQWGFW